MAWRGTCTAIGCCGIVSASRAVMIGVPGSTCAAPTRVIMAPAVVIGGCGWNETPPGTVYASVVNSWLGAGVTGDCIETGLMAKFMLVISMPMLVLAAPVFETGTGVVTAC